MPRNRSRRRRGPRHTPTPLEPQLSSVRNAIRRSEEACPAGGGNRCEDHRFTGLRANDEGGLVDVRGGSQVAASRAKSCRGFEDRPHSDEDAAGTRTVERLTELARDASLQPAET